MDTEEKKRRGAVGTGGLLLLLLLLLLLQRKTESFTALKFSTHCLLVLLLKAVWKQNVASGSEQGSVNGGGLIKSMQQGREVEHLD